MSFILLFAQSVGIYRSVFKLLSIIIIVKVYIVSSPSSAGAIAMYGLWSEDIYRYNLMDVVCSGNEKNILECAHRQVFTSSCSRTSRLSVICQKGIAN